MSLIKFLRMTEIFQLVVTIYSWLLLYFVHCLCTMVTTQLLDVV